MKKKIDNIGLDKKKNCDTLFTDELKKCFLFSPSGKAQGTQK